MPTTARSQPRRNCAVVALLPCRFALSRAALNVLTVSYPKMVVVTAATRQNMASLTPVYLLVPLPWS